MLCTHAIPPWIYAVMAAGFPVGFFAAVATYKTLGMKGLIVGLIILAVLALVAYSRLQQVGC